MKCFISHASALECLRFIDVANAPRSKALPSERGKLQAARLSSFNLSQLGVLSKPVHVMAATPKDRCIANGLHCHVLGKDVSSGSFLQVSQDVYTSAPELCFLQMAETLDVLHLIMLGYEFCGSYRIEREPGGKRLARSEEMPTNGFAVGCDLGDLSGKGFASSQRAPANEFFAGCQTGEKNLARSSMTTVCDMKRYLEPMRGCRGVKRARHALRFVVDGSASPMESLLVVLLCLPPLLGGYGLPFPQMNVSLDTRDVDTFGFRHRACDLLWPEYGLAVEYDSDEYHLGKEKHDADSKRLTTLGLVGLHVESLTKAQVFDARELDRVARLLAKLMGKRLRTNVADVMIRRCRLRRELYGILFGGSRLR